MRVYARETGIVEAPSGADPTENDQDPGNRRKTVGGAGHRARAHPRGRQVRQARGPFRERPLRRHERGGPPGRDPGARGIRRQARQVELRPPAGDPAVLRPEAGGQDQEPPQRGGQARPPQGRDRTRQRLRRGARGRTDLPPHRAVRRRRQGRPEQARAAPLAAVHDPAGHPRRLRQPALRPADAGPGQRRAQPLRGRLARGHQRHARDDGLQLARRRLLPHHRGPRADPHALARRRARGKDPPVRQPRLLGNPCRLPCRGRRIPRQVVRPAVEEGRRRPRGPGRPRLELRARPRDRRRRARQGRHRHRREQAHHPGLAPAVRPDQPAARGQWQVRLLGQDHAGAGAEPVRAPQGP